MKISSIPSTQNWLNQFLKEDRKTAESLLDQLVFVNTDEVILSLGTCISDLIKNYKKVAIFPVRELIKVADSNKESYFPLDDDNLGPTIQPSNASLGSEAFVSNLITQLGRRNKEKVISPEGNGMIPTINNLRIERVNSLIVVDDLIGSGNRTKEFIESIYLHPTIKSWLSGKLIKIHIVSYMGSAKGSMLLQGWCNRHPRSSLNVLNQCPMLDINNIKIIDLCKRYADEKEEFPIGYGDDPVKVVFSHSAPNNLPAILYRNKSNLIPKEGALRAKIKNWKALFPRRALIEALKVELAEIKIMYSVVRMLKELLYIVKSHPNNNINYINDIFSGTDSQLNLCKNRGIDFGWLSESNLKLSLTENGEKEFNFLNNNNQLKVIANNEDNYYPSSLSRAMSPKD